MVTEKRRRRRRRVRVRVRVCIGMVISNGSRVGRAGGKPQSHGSTMSLPVDTRYSDKKAPDNHFSTNSANTLA
jgi:hypothetical protein